MNSRDDMVDAFAARATRLDSAATRLESAPTVLDRLFVGNSVPTVVDEPSSVAAADGTCLVQLPTALRERYRIERRLPTAGSEADLFVVVPLADTSHDGCVLKLYRYGVSPKVDVLAKVRDGRPDHVIRIFEFGQSDGHWFELMEHIALGSLRQFLRGKPLPTANLLEVLRELATGIGHLHAFGLIHRDLKPENILVRDLMPLDLVITDFGISSISDLSQRFTTASRTVRYSAPEALSGLISQAVDYWSLGMMIAEACLGRHPLADLTDERAVTQWLTTRAIDLTGIADARIRMLCRGLLLRDPRRRWGSREVARWLDGDSTLVEPVEDEIAGLTEAGTSKGRTRTPYSIAGEQVWTAEELGVALAKHWEVARKDLGRGLLRRWCERELRDVAIERLFLDLEEGTASPDDKLLTLVLHLCPAIPPCYLGFSLATRADLAHVLSLARTTSEGPEAQRARRVVTALVRRDVLSRFRREQSGEVGALAEKLRAWSNLLKPGLLDALVPPALASVGQSRSRSRGKQEQLEVLSLAIALDERIGTKALSELRDFAATTSFEFWLHDLLDSHLGESSHPVVTAYFSLHLPEIRNWYKREAVWVSQVRRDEHESSKRKHRAEALRRDPERARDSSRGEDGGPSQPLSGARDSATVPADQPERTTRKVSWPLWLWVVLSALALGVLALSLGNSPERAARPTKSVDAADEATVHRAGRSVS